MYFLLFLIGSAPLLSLVNQTNNGTITTTEASDVIVYFKVATNGYLSKAPLLTLKGSDIPSRLHVTYYAATDKGIGGMINNTSNILTFYVRLEIMKYSYQYDDGVYSLKAENKCGQHTLDVTLKGINVELHWVMRAVKIYTLNNFAAQNNIFVKLTEMLLYEAIYLLFDDVCATRNTLLAFQVFVITPSH